MFPHEFIVDKCTGWVNGDVSKLEAFAHLCPFPLDQFIVFAFVSSFLLAAPWIATSWTCCLGHSLVH